MLLIYIFILYVIFARLRGPSTTRIYFSFWFFSYLNFISFSSKKMSFLVKKMSFLVKKCIVIIYASTIYFLMSVYTPYISVNIRCALIITGHLIFELWLCFFDVCKCFFGKVFLLRFQEFQGLHDDLKIIWKRFNPWPLSCAENI